MPYVQNSRRRFWIPYHLSGRQVEHAKKVARELFFENKWDKQIKPLSWLVENSGLFLDGKMKI